MHRGTFIRVFPDGTISKLHTTMAACSENAEVEAEIKNRLSLIPASLLQDLGKMKIIRPSFWTWDATLGFVIQDLTAAFYKHLQKAMTEEEPSQRQVHVLGFDLDEILIKRANQTNPFPNNVSFIHLDITTDTDALKDFLKQHGCPHFHLCLCLAVTMWIHLNHGDSGLLGLLSDLSSCCEYLLLEAQPWKCYRSAARRLRKLGRSDFDHFKSLEIRGDIAGHAQDHLEKHCGMELVQSFGSTTWDRKLLLFKKREKRDRDV
uniref:RNA methyltransferase n=1 Tax=Neogobius melanostomus TaxID=47308 RepID=A0A8C6T4L1_9GOBI